MLGGKEVAEPYPTTRVVFTLPVAVLISKIAPRRFKPEEVVPPTINFVWSQLKAIFQYSFELPIPDVAFQTSEPEVLTFCIAATDPAVTYEFPARSTANVPSQ